MNLIVKFMNKGSNHAKMMHKLSSEKELKYKYFEENGELFSSMVKDIEKAKKYIYIETFRYEGKTIGLNVRSALEKKAREGVEVKLLIDDWGTMVKKEFFSEIKKYNGEVRFFRKLKITRNFIKYNNRRDHRKLIIIDDKIIYLGSSNIAERNASWREFDVRIEGHIAGMFKDVFLDNYNIYNNYFHDKRPHIFPLVYGSFEILRDVPSLKYKMIRDKLISCIGWAKKEIFLETPYFVPDHIFLHALRDAAKRGVKITLIIPKISDVKVVDIMASSYMGKLHKWGVNVKYYEKKFLHAKVALFDDKVFSFGSTNLDHRSFFFQYELNLFGSEKRLNEIVKKHIEQTLKGCSDFNYEVWRRRSIFRKIQEIILRPARTFM